VNEGQTAWIYPGAPECCQDLSRISLTSIENGICAMPYVGAMLCAYCGNGICGAGENWCSCPADCLRENISCKFLWWSDREHRSCGYKQFCGSYSYYGLRTFGSENECLDALQCFPGVKLSASGAGTISDYRGMELWTDGKLAARWNALNIYRQYEYDLVFSCGPHTIDLVNTGNATLHVYRLEAECGLLLSGDKPLDPDHSLGYTYVEECNETCALRGDAMPCGSVSLEEVLGLVNKWINNEASLNDVVRLIDAWAASK
jgi:hypothetical protein